MTDPNTTDHRAFRIAFSYPSGGSVSDLFNRSVAQMCLYEAGKRDIGENLVDYRHLGSMLWQNPSCYVSINRTKACYDLVRFETDDTHLLMIDTDISFEHTIIDKIVAHLWMFPEIDILAGRVNLNNGYPVFYKEEYGAIVHQIQPFYGIREFDFVGTGIIVISKRCYKDLIEKEGHPALFMHQLGETDKRENGDDFSFCKVARKNGYKIYGAWRIFGQHWKEQPVKQSYPEDIIDLAPNFKPATTNSNVK